MIHIRLPHDAWLTTMHAIFPHERDRFYDPDTKGRNFILISEEGEKVAVVDMDSE